MNPIFEQQRLQQWKQDSKTESLTPLLKSLVNNKLSVDERAKMAQIIHESMSANGEKLLLRAFEESMLTEAQFLAWRDAFGLEAVDLQPILLGIFSHKDGHYQEDDDINCITIKESPLFAARKELEAFFATFKVRILTIEDIMQTENLNSTSE